MLMKAIMAMALTAALMSPLDAVAQGAGERAGGGAAGTGTAGMSGSADTGDTSTGIGTPPGASSPAFPQVVENNFED